MGAVNSPVAMLNPWPAFKLFFLNLTLWGGSSAVVAALETEKATSPPCPAVQNNAFKHKKFLRFDKMKRKIKPANPPDAGLVK